MKIFYLMFLTLSNIIHAKVKRVNGFVGLLCNDRKLKSFSLQHRLLFIYSSFI